MKVRVRNVRAEGEVAWQPPVDVLEQDGEVVVAIAVPGVAPALLDVRVSDQDVVVTAARPHVHPEGATVHACEFPAADLARRVRLPVRVNPESAHADCQHGVLRVTAAKAEPSRRVDVTEAAPPASAERLDPEC